MRPIKYNTAWANDVRPSTLQNVLKEYVEHPEGGHRTGNHFIKTPFLLCPGHVFVELFKKVRVFE